jgi:hypothetical protein
LGKQLEINGTRASSSTRHCEQSYKHNNGVK